MDAVITIIRCYLDTKTT